MLRMRIVIADAEAATRELLTKLLEGAGHVVESVTDGQRAVELAARGDVDLLLLDVVMPKMGGLEACRLMKQMPGKAPFVPVILMAPKSDSVSRVAGLSAGVDEYIVKPFEREDVLERVAAMLRVKRMHDKMREARTLLEKVSVRDELTGLHNYRFLLTRLGEAFREAETKRETLAACLFDVDRLKIYNERIGRSFGDEILRYAADTIRHGVRPEATAVRYGPDEFLVLLPATHFIGAVRVAEKIWRAFAAKEWPSRAGEGAVSLSIGISLFPSRDVRVKEALLQCAALALARAKRDGMNRICVFQQHGMVYTPHAFGGSS